MYESPIQVAFSDPMIETLKDKADQVIVRACQEMVPFVNKEELIKALQYDRDQYLKGYTDGLAYTPPVKTHYDQVKAMSPEELADKFEEIQLKTAKAYGNDDLLLKGELKKYWLDWLKQEVEE